METDPAAAARSMRALREGVALHVPDLHVHEVAGRDVADLLQRISSNDLKALAPGRGHANCFTTNKGRIVDWVRLYPLDDALLLFTHASRTAEVAAWIDRYTITEDVTLDEIMTRVALLDLHGPKARDLAAAWLSGDAPALPLHGFVQARAFDADLVVFRVEDLLGHASFRVMAPRDREADLRARLLEAGLAVGANDAVVIDDAAYDAARIETGLPAQGRELSEEHHPLEAGLWDSVSFKKGCYVGQEVIARLNTYDKVMKRLVRLRLTELAPGALQSLVLPAPLFAGDRNAGVLTSLAGPPWLPEWRALGYVHRNFLEPAADLRVAESTVRAEPMP